MRSYSRLFAAALSLAATTACAHSMASSGGMSTGAAPSPDPRVGLKAGMYDAGTAIWNLQLVSTTRRPAQFLKSWNSDLTFTGHYVIQGNFAGYEVWDISNPSQPTLASSFYCPESQSDVSVYKNLLIVSGEDVSSRLDCGTDGIKDTVSKERLRGARIFDISDIAHPKNVANVQTCRGSHTNTLLADPRDPDNIYIYISGSAPVRPEEELAGCTRANALFRIEVIKIPLAHPELAAVVSSPRIFENLTAPEKHGSTQQDIADASKEAAQARAHGHFTVPIEGVEVVVPDGYVPGLLSQEVAARGGTGAPTAADSAKLQADLPSIVAKMMGPEPVPGKSPGPTQCHDITVYPAIGLAGGACEGYGLLLDIKNPTQPVRLTAVADSNFSYWHSATFNNDGTKVVFSDEWGGGVAPKCRATDSKEWGADAIFTISQGQLQMQSYYKMPAPQTKYENCVAHDGSLIPIPGRDVMVQGWYQGGVSVFDFTDAVHPKEIAYFDRGPIDSTRLETGGSWSAYWYNGLIVSSEIQRGLDIFRLTPSAYLTQNEIEAARTVKFDWLNVQGQPKYVWPTTFVLARAYLDQLQRSNGLGEARIAAVRKALAGAEGASGSARHDALTQLASGLDQDAGSSSDAAKVRLLTATVRDLAQSQ